MIIVSADYFGPELKESEIWRAISAAMKAMMEERAVKYHGRLGEVPHVNVVFMVGGSQGKPDFNGVRLGPYSSKKKCVQVDVSVSAEDVKIHEPKSIVVRRLHMANAAAFHFFDDRGMDFPLSEAEELVMNVNRRLARCARPTNEIDS